MRALNLESILVGYVRDADLLAVRRRVRVRALGDDRGLVVHLLRLTGFLMADAVARFEVIHVIAIEINFELLRGDHRIFISATRWSLRCAERSCRTEYER